MSIIKEYDDNGEELISVLIGDSNSDEESFYTYATFATCEEAAEVVAAMQKRIQLQEDQRDDEDCDNNKFKIEDVTDSHLFHSIDVKNDADYEEDIKTTDDSDTKMYFFQINTANKREDVESHRYQSNNTEIGRYSIKKIQETDGREYISNKVVYNCNGKETYKDNYLITQNCIYCGNGYSSAGPLKLHMRYCKFKQNPEKERKCSLCGKVFIDVKNLKQHLLLHGGAYCTRCFRPFPNEEKLKEHIKEHKLEDEQTARLNAKNVVVKAYTCCNCSQQFSVIFKTGGVKRRYVCDPCRAKIAKHEKLKQQAGETAKRKHKYCCNGCERKFVFLGALHRHKDECNGTSSNNSKQLRKN